VFTEKIMHGAVGGERGGGGENIKMVSFTTK
jgi:hypothetical protein